MMTGAPAGGDARPVTPTTKGRREVSVTATLVVTQTDAPLDAMPDDSGPGAPFLDALVARLHAEYGADRDQVRRLAAELLAGFATARVQTFVPILVEKRLRQICRATG
jgi:hypothetical protein